MLPTGRGLWAPQETLQQDTLGLGSWVQEGRVSAGAVQMQTKVQAGGPAVLSCDCRGGT